jgi:predicted permease
MSLSDLLPWVRDRRTRELSDEMRAHLEMATADRIARGESPADAASHARREFGNVGLVREIARDRWSGAWTERLVQDVRIALRMLRRAPGFATVAILTIAVAIGATTAIFSVVDATLLHPLPFPHPEQLVRIEDDLLGPGTRDVGMSTPEWHDLEQTGVFQHISPAWFDDNNLTGMSRAQRVALMIVAPNYFALLGVKPELGATFDPADATPGFNEQVVISDHLWRTTFGRDAKIIGRVVELDSDSYRIVGVMPAGFQSPGRTLQERSSEIWPAFGFSGAPVTVYAARRPLFPGAIARLAPGLSIAEAQHRVDLLTAALKRKYPADYPAQSEWAIRLVPLKDVVVGNVRQPLLYLFGAVAMVLLIGCANVANLLLARATARGREMALRQAIGGAPSRLMRQLLTESVVLSVLGGLAGLVVLLASKGFLLRLVPAALPRMNDVAISWRALGFAFGMSVVAGALFGLAPALQIRGLDLTRALKQEGRASSGSRHQARTRRTLVIGEFALSVVLMIAAVLLLRSFRELVNAPLGFDPQKVTVVRTRLPYPNEPKEDKYATAADQAPFVHEVLRRMRALPGVESAAMGSTSSLPLDHPEEDQNILTVLFDGHVTEPPSLVTGASVTPEYFRLLRIPLVKGRLLTDADDDKSPLVAVVNASMARVYWPGQDAIGKRLKMSPRATAWTTVVGVVGDARTEAIDNSTTPVIYPAMYQRSTKHMAIYLRGQIVRATIGGQVRDAVQGIDAALPVFGASTLDETIAAALAVRRFAIEMIALFALTALALAGLGIYGVMSYIVGERSHEIGVRMALGAERLQVLRMVLGQGLGIAIAGSVVGIVAALLVSRLIASVLYGVSPTDPLTFGVVVVGLTGVALAACYVPARRAIRVDPVETLRY